jgi:hypothetical protein
MFQDPEASSLSSKINRMCEPMKNSQNGGVIPKHKDQKYNNGVWKNIKESNKTAG